MLARLRELWSMVENARDQWHSYLDNDLLESVQATADIESSPHGRTEPGLEERYHALDPIAKSLQGRLDVLVKFNVTQLHDVGHPAELVANRLPIQLHGLETANSLMHRAIDSTEDFLSELRDTIATRELVVSDRFDELRKNYISAKNIVKAAGKSLDVAVRLRRLTAVAQDVVDENDVVGDYEGVMENLEEGQRKLNAYIGTFERQILKFQANVRFVGVKMARQTLITEYFN